MTTLDHKGSGNLIENCVIEMLEYASYAEMYLWYIKLFHIGLVLIIKSFQIEIQAKYIFVQMASMLTIVLSLHSYRGITQ